MEQPYGDDLERIRRDAAIDATKAGYFMQDKAPRTRVKKNFVVSWTGVRGGEKQKKFFTKEGADKYASQMKLASFRHVKVRRQTRQKVAIVT